MARGLAQNAKILSAHTPNHVTCEYGVKYKYISGIIDPTAYSLCMFYERSTTISLRLSISIVQRFSVDSFPNSSKTVPKWRFLENAVYRVSVVFETPKSTSLRVNASVDVFCVKIRLVVSAVGHLKNPPPKKKTTSSAMAEKPHEA